MFGVFGKDWNQGLRKKFMRKQKKNNSFRSKIQFIIVIYY